MFGFPRDGDFSRDGLWVRKKLPARDKRGSSGPIVLSFIGLFFLGLSVWLVVPVEASGSDEWGVLLISLLMVGGGVFLHLRERYEWQLTPKGVETYRQKMTTGVYAPEKPHSSGPVRSDSLFDGFSETTGVVLGVIAGLAAFVGVFAAAVGSAGWVVGIALGWIPAGLAAALAFFTFRYLWWLALILGLGLAGYLASP
jgi:hypothetical protein